MNKILVMPVVCGAVALTAMFAADTLRENTLQRGINLMESKGDLAKAMPLFEEASRSSDKAVAARALLYLGQAQERQGGEKARATYERIVKEFAGQTESVAAAQRRLTALGGPRPAATLAKTQLCPDCGDSEANLSPDGRWMVITDWDTGDLAIRDMSNLTGPLKRLMAKTGTWKNGPDKDAFGETPVFSTDLRQIAYLWDTGETEDRAQLRVMANEPGGKSRVLLDTRENSWYELWGFSRDGESILVTISRPDKTWQLAWVSVANRSVKVLKSLEWRLRGVKTRAEISPDGRYVAYSALATNPKAAEGRVDATDARVYVIAADGSSETVLDRTSGISQSPVWTPDGSHILFTSDRSGTVGLYSMAVQNGKPVGSASLVMPDLGKISPKGMTRAGSYRYSQRETGIEQVSIVDLGPSVNASGRAIRVIESFVGINPSWSPDGKLIAFKRHHPGITMGYDLVVHSLETGDEKTYLTNLGTTGPGQPGWLNGGKSLGTGMNGQPHVVDLESGEFKAASSVPIAAEERIRYPVRRDPKDPATVPDRIVAQDMSTLQETTIYTFPKPGPAGTVLSPDGRTLAVVWTDRKVSPIENHLARVGVDGRNYRDLFVLKAAQIVVAWTKDGSSIFFSQPNESDSKFRIMRISAEGGTPEFTGVEVISPMQNLDLSPDGSRMAFSSTKNGEELWALDNVLSLVK